MSTPDNTTPPSPPQTMTIDQAVATAYAHWNAGQAGPAEHLCRQVLNAWPEHAGALHLMGLLAFTAGNRPLAIEYIRRACASPSAPALFYSNLAEMLRQDGKLVEAEGAARQALQLDSQLQAGWTNLGIVLQEAGKLDESLECLVRAAAINPDGAENHNNLGNTLKRLGRLEEAQAEYAAAIKLKPSYAEAHNNLGHLLTGLGQYEAALSEIRQAIGLNPHYADAYINAAAVAIAMGSPEEALRWLGNLGSFAPNHPGALIAQARALIDCGRENEALEAAKRAFAVAPASGEAADILAQALNLKGRTDEALAMYDQAVTLPCPQPEAAIIGKATLLSELGRSEEAVAALEAALVSNPNSARALFNRSYVKTFAKEDSDIARMESLLENRKLAARDDLVMLHFALGKAWLDAGDETRAFAHYAKGNRLKRTSFAYDSDAVDKWMASITAVFDEPLFKRFAGAGDPSDTPVFVVGMPRSGTTLIEQILASHADVYGAGELKAMEQLADRTIGGDGRPVGFPHIGEVLKTEEAAKLGKLYLNRAKELAPDKARIVDKMPANFLYAGLIRILLPNARIIHVQRDPLDTCLSCYTKLFAGEQKFSYDLAELGRFYKSYETMMAHWRAVLPADRFIDVKYETLVDDLKGEAKRMVAFLGLKWDPACLKYYDNRRQIRTASFENVRRPIYRSSIGRAKPYAKYLAPLTDALAP